jgi:hypothetical protein
MKGAIMDKFEMRISDENDIWGDWVEVRDHVAVAENVFGPRTKHIQSVKYTYKNGSCVEYRRMNK